MLKPYHRSITERALADRVEARPLEEIVAANLHQDHLLTGQIGHPEFHFDDNAFAASAAYIEAQRQRVWQSLRRNRPVSAWRAFGRLVHAAQDLYAHSNYISLWLGRYPAEARPPASEIDPCDEVILASPALHSGRVYYWLEILHLLAPFRDWALARLPRDSHAWMNLDSPERGPLFPYAIEAAVKRTRLEYERTLAGLPAAQKTLFDTGDSRRASD